MAQAVRKPVDEDPFNRLRERIEGVKQTLRRPEMPAALVRAQLRARTAIVTHAEAAAKFREFIAAEHGKARRPSPEWIAASKRAAGDEDQINDQKAKRSMLARTAGEH